MIEPTANRAFRFLADWSNRIGPPGWTGGDTVGPSVWEIGAEVIPTRGVVRALAVFTRPAGFDQLKLHQVKMATRNLG